MGKGDRRSNKFGLEIYFPKLFQLQDLIIFKDILKLFAFDTGEPTNEQWTNFRISSTRVADFCEDLTKSVYNITP